MSPSSEVVVERPVVLALDLHARPAGRIGQLVAMLDAEVDLVVGDRVAPAASVLAVMGLGAVTGQRVVIRARGGDADGAVAAIADVLLTAEEPVPG